MQLITCTAVLFVDIIHFSLSSLDGLLNYQKFETDLVNFPLVLLEILAFFEEFGLNYDVTATKTGVVLKKHIVFLSTPLCVLIIGRRIFQLYFILFSIFIHKY